MPKRHLPGHRRPPIDAAGHWNPSAREATGYQRRTSSPTATPSMAQRPLSSPPLPVTGRRRRSHRSPSPIPRYPLHKQDREKPQIHLTAIVDRIPLPRSKPAPTVVLRSFDRRPTRSLPSSSSVCASFLPSRDVHGQVVTTTALWKTPTVPSIDRGDRALPLGSVLPPSVLPSPAADDAAGATSLRRPLLPETIDRPSSSPRPVPPLPFDPPATKQNSRRPCRSPGSSLSVPPSSSTAPSAEPHHRREPAGLPPEAPS